MTMMSDWINDIRNEQMDLSRRITDVLAPELVDAPLQDQDNSDVDYHLARVLGKHELQDIVHEAVIGYTDWLVFVRMGFEGGVRTQPLPALSEIDYTSLNDKYGVSPSIAQRVVEQMHWQERIPLVGAISEGKIIPDEEIIKRYKALFQE